MKEKKFTAKLSELRSMIDFIKNEAEQLGVKDDILIKIHVIAEEAITNIIHYAYKNYTVENLKKPLKISLSIYDGNNLKLSFIDYGKEYNFEEIKSSQMDKPRIGGLGIYFIKTFSDKVNYIRKENRNILEIDILNCVKSA